MGREPKILLALLATLCGVFLGVLSMKLLVPRPPAAAGPDVTVDLTGAGANEIVEPPDLAPVAAGPAVADAAGVETVPPARIPPWDGDADRVADPGVAAMPATADGTARAPSPRRDPFVAAATLQLPTEPDAEPRPRAAAAGGLGEPPAATLSSSGVEPTREPSATHMARPGDSWWALAERAYGDGRLYRALFAWNRIIDPRVSLAPGTRLELPPRERLEAAWPKLMPSD